MITIIDNYDSFTYNLVQQIERLAREQVTVIRNDAFEPEALLASRPAAVVISPGPGAPARAGRCIDLIRAAASSPAAMPLLGVCLGHQAIGEAFGASVVRGGVPVHGKVHRIQHAARNLFRGCPAPMMAARYHSLVIEPTTLSSEFTIDAEAEDGAIMAITHETRPIFGIQFHPESYGTEDGDRLIMNFLEVVA